LRRALLKEKKENKSPLVPLFQRGIIRQVISPLWKRGVRGDLFLQIPLGPPFSKGEKEENKTAVYPAMVAWHTV